MSAKYLFIFSICAGNLFGVTMKLIIVVTFVIALNLCERTMSADVVNAFVVNEVVPDAVDVTPQEEVKV